MAESDVSRSDVAEGGIPVDTPIPRLGYVGFGAYEQSRGPSIPMARGHSGLALPRVGAGDYRIAMVDTLGEKHSATPRFGLGTRRPGGVRRPRPSPAFDLSSLELKALAISAGLGGLARPIERRRPAIAGLRKC